MQKVSPVTQRKSIVVPAHRMAQLQQIIDARGLAGVNDLLGFWIGQEIEAGTIPAGVPGVTVEIDTTTRRGEITLGELRLNPTSAEALEFSRAIRKMAAGHQKALETKVAKIRANGRGFIVERLGHAGQFSGNAQLMRDVADQIDAALLK